MKRLIVIAVLAVAAAACSSPGELLAENIAENVEGINDVDIDLDTGEIKVETDEGSLSIGGDDIPDDLGVPLPSGYTVSAVIESDAGSSVSVMYGRDRFDELSTHFNEWTSADSADWENSTISVEQGGGTIRGVTWSLGDRAINMTDCLAPDASDALCVIVLDF